MEDRFNLLVTILLKKGAITASEVDWIMRAGEVIGVFAKRTFTDLTDEDFDRIRDASRDTKFADYVAANPVVSEEPVP